MAPTLSEDEIDDLLYAARTNDLDDFTQQQTTLCAREQVDLLALLSATRDVESGNSVMHMAAANNHHGKFKLRFGVAIESSLTEIEFLGSLLKQLPINEVLSLVNARNASGNTPLHWAALNGALDTVKILLERGADPLLTNEAGHDAIYEAELAGREEVVEWVLKEGGEGLEVGIAGGEAEEEEEVNTTREDSNEQGDVVDGVQELKLHEKDIS